MKKEAAWLLAELPGLLQKGILDEAAAARLRGHYAAAAGGSRLGWGMILLATGGAALVGLGVILIFAHNWEAWTPEVRVALSLLPLVLGQAACLAALRSGQRAWSEAAGLFTALAAGASIALIAQTYQFGGDLPRFLMVWLLLATPLIYLLDASAVAATVWFLVLSWIFAQMPGGGGTQQGAWPDALRLPAFLALFALPLPHLMRHIRLDRGSSRVAWLLRVGLLVLVVGLGYTASRIDDDALFGIYASLAAAAALAGARYFGDVHGLWGNPLLTAGRLGVAIIALLVTFEEALGDVSWPDPSLLVLPLSVGGLAAWLAWRAFDSGDRLVAPLLGALTPLVLLLPALGPSASASVLAHAYVLALAAAWIHTGLRNAELELANFGAGLLAALVLLRFFDSDFSYVVRGIGFIATGIAFFVAVFWLRRRVQLAAA